MELNWTKRKLHNLFQGDVEAVRQWQLQYGRFLYTWLYYQLNKDELQAATLTAQVLCQALRELAAFDPEKTTMYLWLKANASCHLQAALTRSGLKVQRPWAWSEIPARVLDSLRRIRNEALIPEVADCGAVMEMVQATLADLSESDREVLLCRYARLNTCEQIAVETGVAVDQISQRLYLARHAFRRGLFFLLQSANPDIAEPTVTGGTELFESNLEVLLRSVSAAAAISSDSTEHIKRAVFQTASEIAQNPLMPAAASNSKVIKIALTGVGTLVLVAAISFWMYDASPPAQHEESSPSEIAQTASVSVPHKQDPQIDPEELKRVLELGVRGDVAGLLEVLNTGGFVAQMSAAHYLGQIGGQSAIVPLLETHARLYPDEPQETPFLRAVEEILLRVSNTEMVEESEVDEPAPPPFPKSSQPPLSGRVVDLSDVPLAGVQITLHNDNGVADTTAPIAGFSTRTDAEGRYAFESLPTGAFLVVVRDPQQRIADICRMVWPVDEMPCTLDFGEMAAVSGAILVNHAPLAEQTLLLSGHFNNPRHGVFTAEMQTDVDGGFLLVDVPPGLYGLFSRYIANRWTLLTQVEVVQADVTAVFDVPTVSVVVRAEELPSPLRIAAVSLRYGPDSSDAIAEWKGVRTEVDTVFDIHRVVPGVYTLCTDLSNGVRMLQEVVVTADVEQELIIDPVSVGTEGISGRFLSAWAEGLTLQSVDARMRAGIMPEDNGRYAVEGLPPGTYAIGTSIRGMFVPLLEVGLFEGRPMAHDIDPVQLAKTRSPLFIFVTDANGRGLSGGQVWLAGDGGFHVAAVFGRGFFVAVPPGDYTLTAVFPGHDAVDRQVRVAASTVQASPSDANTQVIRLSP